MPPVASVGTSTTPRTTPAPLAATLQGVASGGAMLRLGSAGPAVRELQTRLKAAGYALAVDGSFGPQTEAAVKSFQARSGLTADGVVGPKTAAKLLEGSGPAPAPANDDFTPAPAPKVPGGQGVPARSPTALTGSQFLAATAGLTRAQREAAILKEIQSGNVPDFVRGYREITVSAKLADGKVHVAKVPVLPDYVSIGSSSDFVRIPMNPMTAQKVADLFGASLPTRKLVDDVYRQADVKLAPRPLPASPQMMSNGYYANHQRLVQAQLGGSEPDALVAGHKKDVVLSNAVARHPDRVAIYGWHQPNGKAIQPLSTVHENTYADYSHGIRLVSGTITVDGQPMALADVLTDPVLSKLVSDEGPLAITRIP